MKRVAHRLAIVMAAALLAWPFLAYPGEFLYIRYFDANTLFNPWWTIGGLLHVWNYQAHLGFSHARALSYLSVQEILSALMSPLGPDLRNRLSLIATALLIFCAFLWYARLCYPRASGWLALIAAFFYASNAFVVALVHDGYSGLLVDYGLLPLALVLVQWAKRTGRPVVLSLIPVMFLLAGMYTLPSALISMIGVLVLEHRYIISALRSSAIVRRAAVLALSLNLYWFAPLFFQLSTHPKPPIIAESAGDIAILTQFGSLTNVLLLRSFPSIWTSAYGSLRECTACSWYASPWYISAMLYLIVLAVIGFWRARRVDLLTALLATLILATGYRYQDDLIGIPYQLLMDLPIFDAFRASVKFSALTAAFYSIGLLYASSVIAPRLRSHRIYILLAGLSALVVAFPYVSSGIIEHNSGKQFPNFTVTLPHEYESISRNREMFPRNEATLLLPNMPLASYTWGAYGNDFLPALIGRPTIYVSYLPQPNAGINALLGVLTDPSSPDYATRSLMRTMGVCRVLYHSDVVGAPVIREARYGHPMFHEGLVTVLRPPDPMPQFTQSDAAIPAIGTKGLAIYSGLSNRLTVEYDPKIDGRRICSGKTALLLTESLREATGGQFLSVPRLPCVLHGSVEVVADVPNNQMPQIVVVQHKRSYTLAPASVRRHNGLIEITGQVVVGGNTQIHLKQVETRRRAERPMAVGSIVSALLIPRGVHLPQRISSPTVAPFFGGYRFERAPFKRVVVFNESFDPSWQGILQTRSGWHLLNNVTVNFFANGWYVPANDTLWIINTLNIVTWISLAVTALLAIGYVIVFLRGYWEGETS